jgi:membrane associated rhomboid family serine protease
MQMLALLTPVVGGIVSGRLQERRSTPGFPWLSAGTVLLVAAMLALQLHYPVLLERLSRTPALVEGEIWRAVTAIFVQDGGLAGGLFNLVLLLAIGPLAEARLGAGCWAITYFGGGVATEFLAIAWQPYGAGNSIACFALAGTLIITGAASRRGWLAIGSAVIATAAMFALLAARDIHGLGFLAGAAIGAVLVLHHRRAAQNTGS